MPVAMHRSIRRFSKIFVIGLIALGVGAIALVLNLNTERERKRALADIEANLAAQLALRADNIQTRISSLRQYARFLITVPPVQGIVRAYANEGWDADEQSSQSLWMKRLNTIFLGFAKSNPDVYRMRYVGVADRGREIVKVERRFGEPVIVPRDQLEQVEESKFFEGTSKLAAENVYLSELNLARHKGYLLIPQVPSFRVGSPVFDAKGQLFGMVVLNVDMSKMLAEFQRDLPIRNHVYLLNKDGDYLSHPDKNRNFGFDIGMRYRWQDDFNAVPAHYLRDDNRKSNLSLQTDHAHHKYFVLQKKIVLDPLQPSHFLNVVVTVPEQVLIERIEHARNQLLILILGGLLVAAVVLYMYILSRQRKIQVTVEQARLGAIVDSANDAIISQDLAGKVSSWNKAAENLFGHSADNVMGRALDPIIVPDDKKNEAEEVFARVIGGEVVPYFTTLRQRHDGTLIDVSLTMVVLRGAEGKITGVASTVRDITEQKAAQARILALNASLEERVVERTAQLELANQKLTTRTEEAEAANRAKADFLANMSHEIRTPMNAVLGLAYLLEHRPLDSESLALVSKLCNAGRSLQSIINDILDFSKIEAGKLDIEQVPFNLNQVMDNLATIMGANAGNKELELVINMPADLPIELVGDPHRLEQVLINLTGNAIKFTERGSIAVDIQAIEQTDTQVSLRFAVQDTGIGIAADKIEQVFSAFSQADAATTRKYGGTGLGLTICRLLVEKLNGKIGVESKLGQGSTFWFTLPFPLQAAAQIASQHAAPELANLELLVADDSDIARENIAVTAASMGWKTLAVASGHEAISAVDRRKEAKDSYDVVVIDWKMPDLDGLATSAQIRSVLDGQPLPIVIMVTAYSREELAKQPHINLVDSVLSKPVTASSLYDAVAEAQKRRRPGGVPASVVPPGQRILGIRVLVVDDSEINREVAQRILMGEGAEVILANDGRSALDYLGAHPASIDIVLMDVQMPIMDGYTATRLLRQINGCERLPVVALTAGAFKAQQDAAQAAGMDDFVAKPFCVDDLIAVIQRLTHKGSNDAPSVAADITFNKNLLDIPPHVRDAIDIERGLQVWKDWASYQKFLQKFAADYAQSTQAIAMLCADEDFKSALFLVHKLKGAAGSLALQRIANAAANLEAQIQSRSLPTEILEHLRIELEIAVRSINDLGGSPTPAEVPEERVVLSKQSLAPVLNTLLWRLDSDDRRQIEPALLELEALLSDQSVWAIRENIDNFDFRSAEQQVQKLAKEFGVAIEMKEDAVVAISVE